MHRIVHGVAVAALSVMVIACEDGDGVREVRITGTTGDTGMTTRPTTSTTDTNESALACDLRQTAGRCHQLVGSQWPKSVEDSQRTCEKDNGTFREGYTCPPGDLGSCRLEEGDPDEFVIQYYVGDFYSVNDAPDRQRACEQEAGTWAPPT